MNLTTLRPSFPLLGKELTELAARRRTYLICVGYALGLFIDAIIFRPRRPSFGAGGTAACLFWRLRMMKTRKILIFCVVLLISLGARAVEVRDPIWGFDGKIVEGRFNLLSVLVVNKTDKVFEGKFSLYETRGLAGRVGGEWVEACYVAPHSSRWVQFYPYLGDHSDKSEWVLVWGKGKDNRFELLPPQVGAPRPVLLVDADNSFTRGGGFKAFADNLFPLTVSGTDALAAVVLDYAPSWEPARREVFLDWLKRGGTVHLLKGTRGDWPKFFGDSANASTTSLAVLNTSLDRFHVGAGLVVRHDATRQNFNEQSLTAAGFPPPLVTDPAKRRDLDSSTGAQYIRPLEPIVFRNLNAQTTPRHQWGWIYFLNFLYLVIIGPLNWWLGRRWKDYRITILFFLGAVASFSLTFAVVGRRGYGEKSAVHTFSYARAVGDRTYDVTQWTSLFVTRGNDYTVAHPSSHNLYAAWNYQMETIKAVTTGGKDSQFTVDIPLFSSKSIVHQAKMTGHDTSLQVLSWQGEKLLEAFSLGITGKDLPAPTEAWVFYGGQFHPLMIRGGILTLTDSGRSAAADFLGQTTDQYFNSYPYDDIELVKTNADKLFIKFTRSTMARALGIKSGAVVLEDALPDHTDRAHVFLLVPSPDGFRLQSKDFGEETGYTLYHRLLWRNPIGKDTP